MRSGEVPLSDWLLAILPAGSLRGVPAHDGRDRDIIRAWADTLPTVLLPNRLTP